MNLKYSNIITSLILTLILIVFCFYRFFYPIKKVKNELETEKFKKEKEFTFTFYEKYFVISDKKISEKIKYWQLHKVFETKDFFYLYINKDHAFLLDKTTFIKGNTFNFFRFLKKKTWYKLF